MSTALAEVKYNVIFQRNFGLNLQLVSLLEPRVLLSTKRKSGLETENGSKKCKLQHNSSSQSKAVEELLTDVITLGLKRRLRLDEASPSKKTKQVDYSSGSEAQQPVKCSCSFASSHDKRPSDEEMVTSLSCKRVW